MLEKVNAYYEPSSNSIAFPAGILQAPYYSADWPEALAFGAFGSVAGHELTHAFDNAGRQYDKDGRLHSWWTNVRPGPLCRPAPADTARQDTIERFDNLTQCFLDQYGAYTMTSPAGKEVHLNPRLTLGEDMADAGGVAQAFRAWKDRFESDPEGKKFRNFRLPGLDFTREQLFWLAYGRGWARNLEVRLSRRKRRKTS